MDARQVLLRKREDAAAAAQDLAVAAPDLLLVFGATQYFGGPGVFEALRLALPRTVIAGCSTAREIAGREVHDGTCVRAALRFDRATVQASATRLASMADSRESGARLGHGLAADDLAAVIVLATGVHINGSALVRGLQEALPGGASVCGGLAADGGRFNRTWTMGPDGPRGDTLVAVGLYGGRLR